MEKIEFGGAMISVLFVFTIFIVSLCLFLRQWFIDGFKKGYEDAMKSD